MAMFLLVTLLALVLPTIESDCPLIFPDSYCADCNNTLSQCLACVDSSAPEESSGLCHTYSKAFQQDGTPEFFNNAYYNATRKKVQMLDPFCIVKDMTSLASSNNTICGTCAGFKSGSNRQRFVSEDTRECHSTCDYDVKSRYANTNNKCASCATNCFKCLGLNQCQECSYTKKRFSGSVTPNNFLSKSVNGQIDPVADCSEERGSTFTYDYYVTTASSHPTYWTDLNDVFYDIYSQIGNYTNAEINIYLLKHGTNLIHYLLDNNPAGGSRLNGGASYNLRNGDPFAVRLSDRTQSDIKISPLYCGDTLIEGCLDENEKPVIKWRSEVSNIYVTRKVTLQNIILDGADMILSLVNSSTTQGALATACRNSKQECCTGPLFDQFGCSPTNIKYDNWSLQSTQESTGLARRYGVFVFQYNKDAPTVDIPELLIENCEIKNFLYSKYHTSFVQFDIYGGKLTITNSSFDRFFFPHGLISNSHLLVDRNHDPMTSSFTQITCRKVNTTYQGDCYSISLESSNFTNYNPLKTSIATVVYKNRIEGSIMTLHNFDGSISVNQCIFQNMLSFSPLGNIGQNSGVCNVFDFENSTGFALFRQASHNIITTSKYKLFFDKHFRKYYQAPDTQNLPTTAVIHLRNVTKGLTIHNSTFDKISSVAGGSIFINGFNNTYGAPIIITNNQFTNNFAQLMALNILIYKEAADFPSLNCTGIMISNNQFLNNYGCFNTLTNVAIACEPTITSSILGFGEKTFDQYYTGYSSAVSQEHTKTSAASKNFVRYMEEFNQSIGNPYTHPIDPSITFNSNSVTLSNNVLLKNYAILSNGFYCQGIMDLLIENNILQENTIITANSYSNPEFASNVLSINGITPNPLPSSSNIMKESCPLVIRYCNRINILSNIFDGNSQGFRGGDYHIAQAITLATIVGREPVLIQNCAFNNHKGFSADDVTIDYSVGFYDYATTGIITFGYWESLEVQSTNITVNLFAVLNCSFTNNNFANENFGNADTKYIYYMPPVSTYTPGSYSLYYFPHAYFLKYFFEAEMTAMDITSQGRLVAPINPTTLLSYFKNPLVSVQGANVVNNTITKGICGFNNFFFANFEVKYSNFTNNSAEENDSKGQCSAMICALGNLMYYAWDGYTPQVLLSNLRFENITGIELYAERFYYFTAIANAFLTPFYRYVAEDITSIGGSTIYYAQLFNWKSHFMFFNRVIAQNISSPYGLYSAWYCEYVELHNVISFDNYSPQSVVLLYLAYSSNFFISIDTYNNFGVNDENEFDDTLPLVKVDSTQNVTFNGSKFHDLNIPCVFAISTSSSVSVENSTFVNSTITKVLLWTTTSSIFDFQDCQFENLTFSSNALAGIALSDSSTFGFRGGEVSYLVGPQSLILLANLSNSVIQDIVVQNCTASGPNGLITTVLGSLTMDTITFVNNTGQGQGMFSAILMAAFQVSNCIFDSNFAKSVNKLFVITQLLNAGIFTNCEFIDPFNDANFNVDNEENQYQYNSNFINVFDADLTLNNCTFIGGLSAKGAINLLAEDFTLTVSNSKFHNNIGPVGSIGGLASLTIEDTVFYGNTYTIVMTGGNNAEFTRVTFQYEMTLSISLENIDIVIFDQVLFDGLPNSLFRMNDTVYSKMEHKTRGVELISTTQTEIKSSNFKNLEFVNDGICGGGLYIYIPEAAVPLQSHLSISDSSFENITSFEGGAICIQNMALNRLAAEIVDTVIDGCSAQTGGAIYYHSFDDPDNTLAPDYLKVSGITEIINNKAGDDTSGSGGGIYYASKRPDVDSSVSFNGNNAHYGPNWASFPVMIHIIEHPDPEILEEINVIEGSRVLVSNSVVKSLNGNEGIYLASGIIPNPPPVVGFYDIDKQLVWGWNAGTLKLTVSESSVVKEASTTFFATNGYFALYPLELINTPGTSVDVNLNTSVTILSGSQSKTIPISLESTIYFRQCMRGERLTDTRECDACSIDQYILARDFEGTCSRCPDNLECLGGGDIGPHPGYWRFDGWKANAIACLTSKACAGYSRNPEDTRGLLCKEKKNATFCYTGFCSEGYTGNLCSTCINGYAKSSNLCVPCTNNAVLYVILVAAIIVAIFVIVFTVRNALKVKEQNKLNKPKTSILIKIFLNYVQLVSIVGSFQFQWPDGVKTMFTVQNTVASGPAEVFSLDCLFPSQTATSRTFFQKLLFISLSPLVVIIIGTVIWMIIFMAKKTRFDIKLFKANIITTYVVVIFILHSTLVQTSLIAFKCQDIGDDNETKMHVERDLDVECWSKIHLSWALACALPAFVIWGIGTPAFAFNLLKRNLHRLEDADFKTKYGFLYDGYTKTKYYWEFMIMYRKIAMIIISVYMVTLGVKFQALCVLGVCFLSYVLQIYGHPFEDQNLNNIEKRALIIATITLYIGIFYVTGEIPPAADWVFLIIILGLNILFFLSWLKALIQEFIKERKAAKAQKELQKGSTREVQLKPLKTSEAPSLASPLSQTKGILSLSDVLSFMDQPQSPTETLVRKSRFASVFTEK